MSNYDFDYTSIEDRLTILENKILHLEQENIGLTNELYELHNRLDVIDVQQDMNTLKQFTLEK
jgi:hypothetical protein